MGLKWLLLIRMMMSKREALAHGAAVRLHDVRGELEALWGIAPMCRKRGNKKRVPSNDETLFTEN